MKLTDHERASALWLKLSKHYEEKLMQRRRENDSDTLDELRTARQRGKIQEIKDFLALGDEPKVEDED